ncbi:hypothetical protein [Antarcticirhabdus aurantiaca]|uniref:Uncharacterized protein n=1 Tax=Antarcticirhabdus aurantiaca TaxID=2606717 RepID=A0ACD4NK41_9HYPH|nr:hypothetical protein [Antarcticirhabdus aurantiaca]WAJ27141.1 hypothetical protein OXU80_20125 [Jeongeuplla avenae]
MARTPFYANVASGTPYTVPAGKQAVFSTFAINTTSLVTMRINGVDLLSTSSTFPVGPVTAKAGDILSTGGTPLGVSGFLYDA